MNDVKKDTNDTKDRTTQEASPVPSRRRLFAFAGTAGALTAAAVALPATRQAESLTPAEGSAAAQGDGYRLTPHVQRYYQTARV